MKRGQSVLIHSGAGGVGQAAINIATYYDCEIFTTVGTTDKREFIKNTFPHVCTLTMYEILLIIYSIYFIGGHNNWLDLQAEQLNMITVSIDGLNS